MTSHVLRTARSISTFSVCRHGRARYISPDLMSGFVGVEAVKLPRKGTFARPRPTKLRVMADALYWVSKTKNPRSARGMSCKISQL